MILHLYSEKPPSGRCILLAQQICRVTSSAGGISVAEKLFAGHHPPGKPALVRVRSREAVEDLQAVCAEFGITVEVHHDPAAEL